MLPVAGPGGTCRGLNPRSEREQKYDGYGGSRNEGYLLGGPLYKGILVFGGSILGVPYFRKDPKAVEQPGQDVPVVFGAKDAKARGFSLVFP